MNRRFYLPVIALLSMLACTKDGAKNKPKIKLESITDVVPVQGSLSASIRFDQNNAQVSGGYLVTTPHRQNKIPPPNGGIDFPIVDSLPSYPDKDQGLLKLTINWNYLHLVDSPAVDTFKFDIYLVDRSNDTSNTITTGNVMVLSY